MKKFLLNIVFIMIAFVSLSQNIIVSGYINCSETGERLVNANVFNKNTKSGTSTNNTGYYNMMVSPSDSVTLVFSYIGYNTTEITLPAHKNLRFDVDLIQGYLLDEVIIEDASFTDIERRPELSRINISAQQIKTLPAIGGESDVLRVIQSTPGVKAGSEWSTGLYVRGGSAEQNLFLIDGTPLYYVSHLGGFVSTFNTDIIHSVDFITGGFPANYGERLSSVMDVKTKDGNSKEFRGSVAVGILTSKIALEGPVIPDTSSYIFTARRFMYDLIMRPLTYVIMEEEQSLGYSFYDINFKYNHRISSKSHLFFSMYLGDDNYRLNQFGLSDRYTRRAQTKLSWGNKLFAVGLNHIFTPRLSSSISMGYTQYQTMIKSRNRLHEDSFSSLQNSQTQSGINDFISKIDMEYMLWNNSKLKFGISNTIHNFSPIATGYNEKVNNIYTIDTVWNNTKVFGISNAGYVLMESFIGKNFSSNIGFRLSHYNVYDQHYLQPEPRLLLNYNIRGLFALRAGYSEMHQNVHMLSSSNFEIPFDIWVPATDIISPANSRQLALGLVRSFKNNTYELSIEAYRKEMTNLIHYKEGANFTGYYDNWLSIIETDGIGRSKGIEFLLQKQKGRFKGLIGYTLSRSTRQFENINNGQEFVYKYDRTHDASILFSYQINENLNISSTWVYGTGNAYSLPIGKISTIEENHYIHPDNPGLFDYSTSALIYDGVNNHRMRDYHRLDIGINHTKLVKYGERILNFSIYNVYNRQNPFYYYLRFNEGRQEYELRQQSLFPIMPSVSYTLNFNKENLNHLYENYKENSDFSNRKNTKHRIGGQINPVFGTQYSYKQIVYAVRYSYSFTPYLAGGLEYSGTKLEKYSGFALSTTSKNKNYGGFIRFTYPRPRYIQPFFETNAYFTQNIQTTESDDYRGVSNDFSGFIAPGISFIVMDQDVNIDIFYKISNKEVVMDKNRVISYRVSVNF